ncbi:MAG: DMT family transporter [Candidatus Promineifilaceae bacterium]
MNNVNWHHVGLLIIAGTVWGVAFLTLDIGIETIPPFTFVFARNLLASIVLVVALYLRGERLPSFGRFGRNWYPFVFVGFFDNAFPVMLSGNAQLHVESGLATIFVTTTPFFTLLLAYWFLGDEKISPNQVIGVVLGLIGIIVLIGPSALRSLGTHFTAQLALLLASLCYSIATVYSRSYLRAQNNSGQRSVLEWLTGQFIVATLITVPMMLSFDQVRTIQPSGRSIAAVFAGCGIALVAFLAFYRLNALAGPTYASFVTYLIPINGVFWGAVILGERIEPTALAALACILVGIAFVNDFVRLPLAKWIRA